VLDAILYIARPAVSGDAAEGLSSVYNCGKGISTTGEMTACFEKINLSCCCKRAKRRVGNRARRRGSSTSIGQDHESGGARGYDAAKKIKGRKRHIVTILAVCWSVPECTPPMSKIAMVPCWSLRPSTSVSLVTPPVCRQRHNGPNLR